MKKNNEKLSLKKDTLKGLNGGIRTGVKAGFASPEFRKNTGMSTCMACPM